MVIGTAIITVQGFGFRFLFRVQVKVRIMVGVTIEGYVYGLG
jgi:hypothetical protein